MGISRGRTDILGRGSSCCKGPKTETSLLGWNMKKGCEAGGVGVP